MNTRQLTLVTVVAEAVLEAQLLALLREEGATGFTVCDCRGEGSRGLRTGMESGNVRLEAIVSAEAADAIVARLSKTFFTNYAVVAWLTQVNVVRGDKYVR